MYSIPVFSYDHSVSALILEALAMEGYGITYDALYKELFMYFGLIALAAIVLELIFRMFIVKQIPD